MRLTRKEQNAIKVTLQNFMFLLVQIEQKDIAPESKPIIIEIQENLKQLDKTEEFGAYDEPVYKWKLAGKK